MRSKEEIEEAQNEALDAIDRGTNPFPGLGFVDGVQAALDYVLGNTDAKPMDP